MFQHDKRQDEAKLSLKEENVQTIDRDLMVFSMYLLGNLPCRYFGSLALRFKK